MAGGAVASNVKVAGPALTRRQEIFSFALVTSLFFAWGLSYGLIDVLNKKVVEHFGISKLQSTLLQVAYFGAYLVYSVPASLFASRFGYRAGILMGLSLYCLGALAFWPSAHFEKYYGFVISAFVIACGLATLETCANSFISVLGPPEGASFRLNAAQSTNGLAAFVGPLIASKTFFSGKNANNLNDVQYVYLAVACFGAALFVLFFFAKLPNITDADMEDQATSSGIVDERPVWQRKHTMFGFLTQLFYVGAQVSTASFVLFYLTETDGITSAQASQMLSYLQITFMVARFASTPLLRFFNPCLVLAAYGSSCTIFSLVAALTGGKAGLAALFLVFFSESVIYPTTFTLATSYNGRHTKRAAGILCMGVAGGSFFPSAQGAFADAKGTRISYIVPMLGFSACAFYGAGMYFYMRRQAKLIADNAVLAGPAVPVVADVNALEKEESIEKVEIEDTRLEAVSRV
ncbi:hypothetical protein NBRC10512_003149 [Rhodotorula toruloides]|uniref:RHTO0S05e09230g1_1 n=2 Tax=Rhodotorula toruloides TaxID=5286 RepID=A0A061B1Q9_RHOTO|nr:L-fucose transporter [Rhodotorula toruloides NP11]EMS23742.1 L-fucose transporter [Rhodotorula toruloides NP11]KAJ8294086.1 Glucose/galactose transporter [Rhodotorula toruloides]CDR40936.1 RHTO0S05e09230g1_1 [Rhodotorula toruloides]